MRNSMTWLRLAAGMTLVGAFAACENAGVDLGFVETETGTVLVAAYLDRDGSRSLTALDTSYANARIALLSRISNDTLRTATTAANGVAAFDDVPLGEYTVAVALGSLGDSLEVDDIADAVVRVEPLPDTVATIVRLAYPEASLREVRNLPLGKRVFVRGVVLVGVQAFRDTTSHIVDTSSALRLTRVSLRGGLTGNAPGDSVSVLGVTSSRLGQPTLDQAVVSRVATRPQPIPLQVTSGIAATASSGSLDANLVQVAGATITDTVTVAPDFHVTITDGSGSLVVVLDANINFARTNFRPNRGLSVRGVLVPNGTGGWWLKPRVTGDVDLF